MLDAPNPGAPPESWKEFRARNHRHWTKYFLYPDWFFSQTAWILSRWSLLKVLAYAETFSVLVALIVWIAESKERTQQKHYQAWQVINTAQGKGGSGGRVDAMEQLNDDHVPLVGVDVAEAFLQDVRLDKAELRRSTFRAADMRNAHLRKADLEDATLTFANLRQADLRSADLTGAVLIDSDLNGANLRSANFHRASFDRADLRDADLSDVDNWKNIASIRLANIDGVKNPPDGFVAWATAHGAVQMHSTQAWNDALAAEPKPK